MRKRLKYIIGFAVLLLIAYHSVYFRKLDEVEASSKKFDAKAYARDYFNNKLIPALHDAIGVNELLTFLQSNKEEAFKKYSHALGIGNIRYFLVRGKGKVVSVNEDDVSLLTGEGDSQKKVHIATEFVFGNAIRDAAGQININDFTNTMDFNSVSSEINKIIRSEILPPFKDAVKKGDLVRFGGAIELNKEHLKIEDPEVIPAQLEILTRDPVSKR